MRILVIEDNRHLNYELKMSLLDAGYAVDSAFDGEEGQALAEICIRRLRNQVDDPFEVKLIETIRGVGYRLRTPDPR